MSAKQGATGYALGVALSGGGFRGAVHIGVLRELKRRDLGPDFIADTDWGWDLWRSADFAR
jgi:predicted acylesterase/phospholipase RssA